MKNSIKLVLLVISALLFNGCTIQEYEGIQLVGWSVEEEKTISAALDDWGTDGDIYISSNSKNKIIKVDTLPGTKIGEIKYISNGYDERYVVISIVFDSDKQLKMTTHHELGHFLAWYNRFDYYNDHLPAGNAMAATDIYASEELTNADFQFAYGN